MNLEQLDTDDFIERLEVLRSILKVEGNHFVFQLSDNEIDQYEISISSCNTPEKLLSWIFHLTEKQWMNTELLRYFIRVASVKSNIKIN
ncbi:TPA: hypothetical protein ACYSAK_001830 [Proteus mirabilis]|uniref:hypothetical protein n=1 Tax=Proteus mirabilis TaxID=584 RepID=UPI00391CE871